MLIIALVVAALIALGLGSMLSLNLTSSRLAKRTLHGFAGLNLVEAGVEEGTWSINRAAAGDTAAWAGWTQGTGDAWRRFSGFDLGDGSATTVKVYVNRFAPPVGAQPKIIALASIAQGSEAPVTKMLEVTLRRRSFFANGIVAKESLVFSGANPAVDSWNSDPDNNPATPPVDYSLAVRVDHGSVASGSAAVDALKVNHAQIWGYASTGGAPPKFLASGSVRGTTTPVGLAVDPSRIATDFNADFPAIPMPAGGTAIPAITGTASLGTPGTTTRWRTTGVTLSGSEKLTIYGDVTLVITAPPGTDGVKVTGSAEIVIPAGSTLALYTESDVRIAGRGVTNGNIQASSFTIWGTNTSPTGQNFDVVGNGTLRGVIYAPNAAVSIHGNGDVMGSVVARDITLTGNAAFHYDEALAETGATAPFGISKWRELTSAADRAAYDPLFSGW
ncbi:MAG TPA: hypothetical protein VHO24_02575 [Opitutaceae bacterium]|nr:hypothetical protein [Opitutaceae bacterium]